MAEQLQKQIRHRTQRTEHTPVQHEPVTAPEHALAAIEEADVCQEAISKELERWNQLKHDLGA